MTASVGRHTSASKRLGHRVRLWLVGVLAMGMALSGTGAAYAATPETDAEPTPVATASISGTITDADTGAGIADATVVALDTDGATSAQTTTTSSGGYTLAGLTAGSYYVSVTASGYETAFWPAAAAVASATAVDVTDGAAVTGIDVTVTSGLPPVDAAPGDASEGEDADSGEGTGAAEDADGQDAAPEAGDTTDDPETPADEEQPDTGMLQRGDGGDFGVLKADTFSISGTLTNANNEPIAYAGVRVSGNNGWGSTTTDADGRYTVSDLPPGSYTVRFVASGYVEQYYSGAVEWSLASSVVIEDEDRTGIDDVLQKYGTVTGALHGVPAGTTVFVQAFSAATGYQETSLMVEGPTYSLSLAPGEYYVRVQSDEPRTFATTYAPSAPEQALAETVVVTEGATTADVDIEVLSGFTISGAVTADGPISGDVWLISGDGEMIFGWTEDDGTFSFPHTAPGTYLVQFTTVVDGITYAGYHGGLTRGQATPVEVTDADRPDIDITTVYGSGGIVGTVSTEAEVDPEDLSTQVTAYRWNGASWDEAMSVSGWGSYSLGAYSYSSGGGYAYMWLPEGEYTVSFTEPEAGGIIYMRAGESSYPFCDQWFDAVLTQDEATRIPVAVGQVASGIDAQLVLKETGCAPTPSVEPGTPSISGTPKVGETLTVSPGTWAPDPVELAYQWLADGEPVDGATGTTLALTADQLDAEISVIVTGSRPGHRSATAEADAVGPVQPGILNPGTVEITGEATVGQTLTATESGWPEGATLSRQWSVGSTPVPNATGTTYVPTADDTGKTVTVQVTATKTGYSPADRTSAPTSPVQGVLSPATPTISGTARVGETLTADPGAWGPSPVTLGYAWYADGVAISGATASTLTLGADQLGAAITVKVTGTKADHATAVRESAATAKVAPATLTVGTATIAGEPVAGATLTANTAGWGPGDVTFAYQWAADGAPIVGATGRTLVLGNAQHGAVITVTVTGSKPGYTSESTTSAATAAVQGVVVPGTPTITGTTSVGSTLTANPGEWGPGAVELAYQWFQDGTAITGATGTTFTLTEAQYGAKLTVTVTGTKSGYRSGSATSAPSAGVRAAVASIQATGDIIAGEDIEVTGSGFAPFELVRLELHSTPIYLTTVRADEFGAFRVTVRVPASVPAGMHHVVAYGESGAPVEDAVRVRVLSEQGLPATGGTTPWTALLFGGMLLVGGAALLTVRAARRTR